MWTAETLISYQLKHKQWAARLAFQGQSKYRNVTNCFSEALKAEAGAKCHQGWDVHWHLWASFYHLRELRRNSDAIYTPLCGVLAARFTKWNPVNKLSLVYPVCRYTWTDLLWPLSIRAWNIVSYWFKESVFLNRLQILGEQGPSLLTSLALAFAVSVMYHYGTNHSTI